jgi:serine phosphatase RsbU (regulator of sigma subunit)
VKEGETIVEAIVSSADILNAKILVVDDKPDNVHLIEGVLRVAGYHCVESTTNPTEVCELHRKNRYGLILLDLQMPGMDGFQVMERLKEIEGDGYLPVLAITAQPAHKLHALAAGARDFVSKPFEMAELQSRVRNLIEVRLLHLATKQYSKMLEKTVRELEASREVIRLKTLEEQKRSEEELTVAQETQESLLPRVLPNLGDYRLHAFNSPTRYVGGDFYDFVPLGSGEWVGVLADVSGKGIPAALLSSMVLGALNMEFQSGTRPGEVLNRINRLLCEKSLPYQFVTLFLFFLGPGGAGKFVNAGHNPAYLYHSATGQIDVLVSGHYFLGTFDFATYESSPLHLDKGDILVVYSDGLTDAENRREEMFGETRLQEIVRQEAGAGSQALERRLLTEIEEFTEGTPQTDDITFVIVERCR